MSTEQPHFPQTLVLVARLTRFHTTVWRWVSVSRTATIINLLAHQDHGRCRQTTTCAAECSLRKQNIVKQFNTTTALHNRYACSVNVFLPTLAWNAAVTSCQYSRVEVLVIGAHCLAFLQTAEVEEVRGSVHLMIELLRVC